MHVSPRDPDPPRDARAALPVLENRAFGRYTLCLEVAQGGMASVHLAQIRSDAGFRKWTAVKIIRPELARDARYVQMFLDEARLAARIEHPNVCAVFDVGEHQGAYFLAMEYLHGEPLDGVLRASGLRSGLPREIAARVIADAARGLHAAHELRDAHGRSTEVVHRDVSPQNIFVLYEGPAKVVDFGIARSRMRLAERTSHGGRMGKLAYMAPEQVRDEPVDRRTDVFALGVVLWECTMGRRLFKRDGDAPTMAAIVRAEVPAPTALDPSYPPALEAIVLRALAREPSARYGSADAMARELDAYLSQAGVASGPGLVADFMRALFAERIETRNAVLRAGLEHEGDAAPTRAAPARAQPTGSEPTLTSAGLGVAAPATATVTDARVMRRSLGRRAALPAALLAATAVLVAGIARGVHARPAAHASATATHAALPRPLTAPVATREPPAAVVAQPEPPPTPSPSPPRTVHHAAALHRMHAASGEPALLPHYNSLRPR